MTENNPNKKNTPNRQIAVALVVLALVLAVAAFWSARKKADTAGDAQSGETVPEAAATGDLPGGHLYFIGDSRTIDMFYDSDDQIAGEEHDGVLIYGGHGCPYEYLETLTETIPVTGQDTLVTWMGANDMGEYAPYLALYDKLLAQGTRLVVCTVGPTGSDLVEVWYNEPYSNTYMQQFNTGLISWASQRGVPVIDLYSYVKNNVQIDMSDGVHYLPRPDPVLWGYILEKLDAYGVRQGP